MVPLNDLLKQLQHIGAIKHGHFVLKSGRTSSIYVDLRGLISHPQLLQMAGLALWEKSKSEQPQLVCGVPYTALPIATAISLQQQLPMLMCRKESKQYGTKKMVEGDFSPGQSCLLIEDVITTGGSVLETAEKLKTNGVNVEDIAVIVDRQQGGREAIEQAGYRLHALFTLSELSEQKE